MKKLLFSIILTFYVSISQAGIIFDGDIFTCDGATCTPKYGMLLNGAGSAGITVGSSPIASGTNGYLLYNNAGILGNLNPAGLTLAWGQITGTPTTLAGYGITDAANIALSNVTGTLSILHGGTGQTTANTALNALLPSQTSNSGKVLQTDGSNTSWATSSSASLSSKASAYFNNGGSNLSITSATWTLVPFDTTFYDTRGELDVTVNKGRFTSISGGYYLVTAAVYNLASGGQGNNTNELTLYKNGSQLFQGPVEFSSGVGVAIPGFSGVAKLSPGDYIEIWTYSDFSTVSIVSSITDTWISIIQIQ